MKSKYLIHGSNCRIIILRVTNKYNIYSRKNNQSIIFSENVVLHTVCYQPIKIEIASHIIYHIYRYVISLMHYSDIQLLLYKYIDNGNTAMVEHLMPKIGKNKTNKYDNYALMLACISANGKIFKLLCDNNIINCSQLIEKPHFLTTRDINFLDDIVNNGCICPRLLSNCLLRCMGDVCIPLPFDYFKKIVDNYFEITDNRIVKEVCIYGDVPSFRYLIELGIDINYTVDGQHAVDHALGTGNIQMLKLVLDNGFDIEKIKRDTIIKFFDRRHYFNINMLDYLIENYDHVSNMIEYTDRLKNLCIKNDLDKFKQVFDNSDHYTQENLDILRCAILFGKIEIFDYIINNLTCEYDQDTIDYMVKISPRLAIIFFSIHGYTKYLELDEILRFCCMTNNTGLINELLDNNDFDNDQLINIINTLLLMCDVIVSDIIDNILLHRVRDLQIPQCQKLFSIATDNFNYDILDYLFQIGFDFNNGLCGITNIRSPGKMRHMLHYLVNNSYDINTKIYFSEKYNTQMSIIGMLISMCIDDDGDDVDISDKFLVDMIKYIEDLGYHNYSNLDSYFLSAVDSGYIRTAERFFNLGANISIISNDILRKLIMCEFRDQSIVIFLFKNGLEPDEDIDVLEYAIYNEKDKLVEYLLDNGANVTDECLKIAFLSQNDHIIKLVNKFN